MCVPAGLLPVCVCAGRVQFHVSCRHSEAGRNISRAPHSLPGGTIRLPVAVRAAIQSQTIIPQRCHGGRRPEDSHDLLSRVKVRKGAQGDGWLGWVLAEAERGLAGG